jgi:hypothetical protein
MYVACTTQPLTSGWCLCLCRSSILSSLELLLLGQGQTDCRGQSRIGKHPGPHYILQQKFGVWWTPLHIVRKSRRTSAQRAHQSKSGMQAVCTARALRATLRQPSRPCYDLWSTKGGVLSPLLAPLPGGITYICATAATKPTKLKGALGVIDVHKHLYLR